MACLVQNTSTVGEYFPSSKVLWQYECVKIALQMCMTIHFPATCVNLVRNVLKLDCMFDAL